MKNTTIKYVGLDTHKDSIVIALADEGRSGEISIAEHLRIRHILLP